MKFWTHLRTGSVRFSYSTLSLYIVAVEVIMTSYFSHFCGGNPSAPLRMKPWKLNTKQNRKAECTIFMCSFRSQLLTVCFAFLFEWVQARFNQQASLTTGSYEQLVVRVCGWRNRMGCHMAHSSQLWPEELNSEQIPNKRAVNKLNWLRNVIRHTPITFQNQLIPHKMGIFCWMGSGAIQSLMS